jgi:iron complex outermembrane receptor protein
MDRIHLRALLLAGGAAILATSGAPALAQESPAAPSVASLEEIVVTARRREENLQTTPVAITALSSATLEARNVVNLVDVSHVAPNMQIQATPGALGSAGMAIRGIGYGDNVLGQDSPIGVYVDGVAYGRISTATMDLVAPDRVEVLRGPQGTLFGRNTTAGAILITSHTPSDQFGGEVKASYGTFNARGFQARIDTGLLANSGIKVSMAYSHRQQDGTQDIGTLPRNLDPGAQTSDSYWFKAVGEWGDFRASLSGDYSELKGNPEMLQVVDATPAVRNFIANSANYGLPAPPVQIAPLYSVPQYGFAGEQHIWNQGLALNLEYRVADYLTLKSITGMRAYKRNDPDATGPSVRGPVLAGGLQTFDSMYSVDPRNQRQRQISEEVQALGTLGDFNYVAGLYYFHENGWDQGLSTLPFALANGALALPVVTPRFYSVDSKSVAGFTQVDWRPSFFDKKLELTGGIRYTQDTRDFQQTVALVRSANLKTHNTSYMLSANYQWTDGLMTYVKYSTGYRAGGFNVRSTPPIDPVYQPEKIKATEIGFKLDTFNRRVRLNGALFYNKYNDLQVAQFAPPSSSGSGGSMAVNADATYKGYELEFTAIPIERLTFSASLGHVDPEYTKFPRSLIGTSLSPGCVPINNSAGVAVGQDCAAIASVTAVPRTTADIGLNYDFPEQPYGKLSARIDYTHRSHIDWGTFDLPDTPFKNSIKGNPYGLLSARATLSDIPIAGQARAQIAIFGENLTDEEYNAQGIDLSFMGTITYGLRRTFGVEAKIDF